MPKSKVLKELIFDPANIRSTNAAFDPANIGKSDILGNADPKLLAALGGAGAVAALSSEEAEAAPFGSIAKQTGLKTRIAKHGTPHDFPPVVKLRQKSTGKTHYMDEASWKSMGGPEGKMPDAELIAVIPEGRFSVSKIGTGEGAQAYGHGLYFSSSEDIARFYRDSLSKRRLVSKDTGNEVSYQDIKRVAGNQMLANNPNLTAEQVDMYSAAAADIHAAGASSAGRNPDVKLAHKYLKDHYEFEGEGKLYTVEIPDESHMLDWDKPIKDQPDTVKDAAAELIAKSAGADGDNLEMMVKVIRPQMDTADMTGQDVYRKVMQTNYDMSTGPENRANFASQQFRERDIPGITYKGGTSGERNFVVFDDELINILEKGQVDPKLLPGLAAAGAAGSYMIASKPEADFGDLITHVGKSLILGMAEMFTAIDPSIPIGKEAGAEGVFGHAATMDRWNRLLNGDEPLTPGGQAAFTEILEHGALQEIMAFPGVLETLKYVYEGAQTLQGKIEEIREDSPRTAAALDLINPSPL